MSNEFQIEIGNLFNEYLSNGFDVINHGDGYQLIDVSNENLEIKTDGGKYSKIVFLSRHKTNKHIIKITLKDGHYIDVTTDHVCMRYNKNHMLESVSAKDLTIHEYVKVLDNDVEKLGEIVSIEDIGPSNEYVYDLEVDTDDHTFYGNDILVHNSQFLNIQCITQWFRKENNLGEKLNDWSDLDKIRLWEYVENFVNNEITPFVQKLLKVKCGCEDTSMLRYGLEYIADCGIYQAKKNYAIHKIISEGPELVDKNKYTGIELRRNTMSAKTKDFLAEIYENTLKLNWTEKEFRDFIYKSYDEYMKLSIDEIAQWKGYNTAKKSNGFMQFEKGASGISKACGAYNDLLKFYKIQEKYDTINVGDKVQFIYVTETNRFGIDAIAYKGRWPKEFNKDLKPDYRKMFDKCIMSPIKNFMTAMGYQNVDPTQKTLFDVFNF